MFSACVSSPSLSDAPLLQQTRCAPRPASGMFPLFLQGLPHGALASPVPRPPALPVLLAWPWEPVSPASRRVPAPAPRAAPRVSAALGGHSVCVAAFRCRTAKQGIESVASVPAAELRLAASPPSNTQPLTAEQMPGRGCHGDEPSLAVPSRLPVPETKVFSQQCVAASDARKPYFQCHACPEQQVALLPRPVVLPPN